jgi:lysyl-tRNA synthetase class 2
VNTIPSNPELAPSPREPGIPSSQALQLRSRVLRACREFFWGAGFCEVETPVRIPAPAPEMHIHAPPSGAAWLRTSPELHMKRILAAGEERIFQIGPCFREGEQGSRHAPEFTMLEWYRRQADYRDILRDCGELLSHVVRRVTGGEGFTCHGQAVDVASPWHLLTVQEAYRRFAGWDPLTDYDADRFDLDMVRIVEPALPRDRPCILMDYPVQAAALARLRPGPPAVAERWELYLGGLEIANAYSELTDPGEQRARFEACNVARGASGAAVYPLDEGFLRALQHGLPPCGGIALGIDRLVMALGDARVLAGIRAFAGPADPA